MKLANISTLTIGLMLAVASRAGAQALAGPVYDPAESFNRKISAFNQAADRAVILPVAQTYEHLPFPIRMGAHNFVVNLSEPEVFVNDVLQFNFRRAGVTLSRFGVNCTAGVGGLFDVAGRAGLKHHAGDLGLTFGRWGVPPGPHVELPLLGPSSLRDTVGSVGGAFVNPLSLSKASTMSTLRTSGAAIGMMDGRARLIPTLDLVKAQSPDLYVALRDLAAAHREALVREARNGVGHTPADAAEPGPAIDLAPVKAN